MSHFKMLKDIMIKYREKKSMNILELSKALSRLRLTVSFPRADGQVGYNWRSGRLWLGRAVREYSTDLFFTSQQGVWNSEIELVRGKICAIVRAQKFPSEGTIVG